MKGASGKQSHFTAFLVAPGLRILPGFAAICRWRLLICFVFNRGMRFPKPKVACSTHAGATTFPQIRPKQGLQILAISKEAVTDTLFPRASILPQAAKP